MFNQTFSENVALLKYKRKVYSNLQAVWRNGVFKFLLGLWTLQIAIFQGIIHACDVYVTLLSTVCNLKKKWKLFPAIIFFAI